MTLSTNIYVLDEIDPMEVFMRGRELLGCTEENPWSDNPGYDEDGSRYLHNHPGQGLDAWLTVYYRPNAPLNDEDRKRKQNAKWHEEWCVPYPDEPCDGDHGITVSYLTINFDTAYGYTDELGRGCSHLHADYIISLGVWLDVLGIKWKWANEFTGEVHEGFAGLEEFVGGGVQARSWFENVVKPAIQGEHPGAEFF